MQGRSRAATVALIAAVLAGLGLRAYHYGRDRPVWHDEAALVINALDKTYAELLGPLYFHEAGPPLFLWLTRAAAQALGEGALALRLAPFLASCLALVGVAVVSRRLLAPGGAALAAALFALSEMLSWHACEAKPYAVDVLLAVGAVWLSTRFGPERLCAPLLCFSLAAPVAIWLSFPACFVLGGVILAYAGPVWRSRRREAWACLGLLTLATCGAFLALLLGPIRAQHDPTIHGEWMRLGGFPDYGRPGKALVWVLTIPFELGRYALKPAGHVLIPLAALGALLWWRRGQRERVILLAAPIALVYFAALVHRYPFSGSRVVVFAVPALVLLAGAAVPWLLERAPRAAALALAALLLVSAGNAAHKVARPWDQPDVPGAVARLLAARQPGEPVVISDWTHQFYLRGLDPAPRYEAPAAPGRRCWVIVSTYGETASYRLQVARNLAPPGWEVEARSEAHMATVVAFVPPRLSRAGSAP
jgi:Dolichyl-phosphate-mannose-protein mannosyltransferase